MHYAAMMVIAAVISIGLGSNSDAFDKSYEAAVAGEYGTALTEFGTAMRQVIREADVHNQHRYPPY